MSSKSSKRKAVAAADPVVEPEAVEDEAKRLKTAEDLAEVRAALGDPSEEAAPPAPEQPSVAPSASNKPSFQSLFAEAPVGGVKFQNRQQNTSGGLQAGFNACALVLNSYTIESAQGPKKTMDVVIKAANVTGGGCDKVVGTHMAFGLAVRQEPLPPERASVNGMKQANPKFFDGSPNDMRAFTLCNRAITVSFFPTKEGDRKELPPLPRAGAMVDLRGVTISYGKKDRDSVYFNATHFTIVSESPSDAWMGVSDAFGGLLTPSLQAASAMGAAVSCGGMALHDLSDGQKEQRAKLEAMAKNDFAKLSTSIDFAITANRNLYSGEEAPPESKAANGALVQWKNTFDNLASDTEPLKTLADSWNHPLFSQLEAGSDKRAGLPVSIVLQGSTPARAYDNALEAMRDQSAELPSGAVAAFQYMGHYISDSCKLLRVAYTHWILADGTAFREKMETEGDFSVLRPPAPTIGAKIVNKKITDQYLSNYQHRVITLINEVVPHQDVAINVLAKPMSAPNPEATQQTELDAPFADLYALDLRGTLDRIAPSMERDDVVKILGATIVTPAALAKMPMVADAAVGPATFAEKYVMPLQETGVDLADLDSTAAACGGSVKYVAVWPGCVEAAWADGVVAAAPAMPLLEAAAGKSGMSVKQFVSEVATIYALVVAAA